MVGGQGRVWRLRQGGRRSRNGGLLLLGSGQDALRREVFEEADAGARYGEGNPKRSGRGPADAKACEAPADAHVLAAPPRFTDLRQRQLIGRDPRLGPYIGLGAMSPRGS